MPKIPKPADDEMVCILRSYGHVSFYASAHDEMNMCRVTGAPLQVNVYDRAYGSYRGTDMEAAHTSYIQLYLTMWNVVWETIGDKE